MPSDETTSLLPEGNSLNRRRKCCKHFSWRGILWIVFSLLLVTDVVVSIHYNLPNVSSCSPATDASNTKNTSDGTTSSPTTPPSNPPSEPRKPENEIVKINASKILLGFPITYRNEGKNKVVADHGGNEVVADDADMQNAECIFSNGMDTINCWIFLGIVATSPHFVGCLTILRNLIRLPRSWTLIFLLALYVAGAVILVIHSPALQRGMPIGCLIMDLLNAFTMLAMVGTLNHVEVRNLEQGHSRYKRLLLKGALFVFFNHLLCSLMGTIFSVNFALFYATDVNSSDKEGSLTTPVTNVLFLPFVIKITELMWTKIFHDEKCIIDV
ncbi:uncharacterized protein LOC144656402 isoform X1 [Oculina patagonica]